MKEVSVREYGRMRGCSEAAVRRAVKTGKISNGYDPLSKRIKVDIANSEWSANFDPTRIQNKNIPEGLKIEEPAAQQTPANFEADDPTMSSAKKAKAVYSAKILGLKLQKEQGILVSKDKVYAALFAAGQELRTRIQGIPDKAIDNILAAKSRLEAHAVLYNAIEEELATFAEIYKRDLSK